ncbi:MAG: murein biosynthesis integral membrane protein MurJ [Verrucomicrobia bacterium]|nr:murein biosynthesis integral membrane protein MurJ [Verrucomicrobiota bacterium]
MKKSKVISAAGVVGGLTGISRILGMVRDILMAGFFGTSLVSSAFYVAFTIPNLFRRLFGEGALSAAFVPVFVETREKEGDPAAWSLARRIITLVGLVLLLIVIAGIVVTTLMLAGAEPGTRSEAVLRLLRIMLPYMLFICLTGLSMGILNSFKHFAVPAAAPCILNVVWILTILFVCPLLGSTAEVQIRGIAWAVLIAGFLQLAAQLPMLSRFGYHPGISFDWRDRKVKRVFLLMGPAALGMAVTQINVAVDKVLALWAGAWAPAALFFSERLIYLPMGLFATALGTVLLPVLSGHAARKDTRQIRETVNHALRNLLFVMAPASIGLLILARPIVSLLFGWKSFDESSVQFTSVALQFYAPGLLIFSLAKVFVPSFYAMQDTKTPVKVGLVTVVVKLALSLLFVTTWPAHLKHAGLAFSTVLAESLFAICLAVILQKRIGSLGWDSIFRSAARAFAGAGVMGLTVWKVNGVLVRAFHGLAAHPKLLQVATVSGSIACGMLVYWLISLALRSEELKDIRQALKR